MTLISWIGKRACRRAIAVSKRSSSTLLKSVASSGLHNQISFRRFTAPGHVDTSEWSEKELEMYRLGEIDAAGFTLFETLHELQERSCKLFEQESLFGTYNDETNKYEWMTFGDYDEKVKQCRLFLKEELGISQFDKLGIISNNRWEWATVAAAAYSLNATVVPMYEAQLPSDWTYILNDSGACVVFCATADIYHKVRTQVLPSTPHVKANVCFDKKNHDDDSMMIFENELDKFETTRDDHFVTSMISAPTPEDLANLIYTSGTTGKPKGVELTHHNVASNVIAGTRSMVENPRDLISEDDVTLSFLPWAHSYGQTCELWTAVSHGASLGICRGVPHILQDLQMVKPTMLFAVPTLFKKVYDGVNNTIETSSPFKKNLMKRALQIGREKFHANMGDRPPLNFLERLQYRLLDNLVLSKIKDRFGGRLRYGYVGGAACPPEVLAFMDDLGIPICEGYGLTETSPLISVCTPFARDHGSVGRPVGGVKVYIMDNETNTALDIGKEGEICCVGPNVMRGYYKNQEATDEVISIAPDGKSRMFHTGDLGRMDEQGFLRVTGRLKEQYKLENGKYVVPTPIEEAIGLSRFIAQVVLYGANRPHNIALIVPEWSAIRIELDAPDSMTEDDMIKDPRVKTLMDDEIHDSCYKMKKFEIPTAWAFVAPFTAANNMLTPKMSIRRHKVIETYKDVIEQLYNGEEATAADAA